MNVAQAPGTPGKGCHASPLGLAENVVRFVRLLRAAGFRCGAGASREALVAVGEVGLSDRHVFHDALAAVLVSRTAELATFDQAFELFWRNPQRLPKSLEDLLAELKSRLVPQSSQHLSERVAAAYFAAPPRTGRGGSDRDLRFDCRGTASGRERLFQRDFEQLSPDEFFELKRLIRKLRPCLPTRGSRRTRTARNGHLLDWRATARGLTRGRLDLWQRRPRKVPVPLVALCDMSGSMAGYTRATLLFFHALCQERLPVEVFVFATRLTRVTPELRYRDPDVALALATTAANDWEGGTRIAGCLERFVDVWLRRVLVRPSDLILVTDGLDGGDPEADRIRERLSAALRRLHASARSVAWVNPMLRYAGYEPRALGASVLEARIGPALPGHNLESLCQLFDRRGARYTSRRVPSGRFCDRALRQATRRGNP